MVDQLAMGSRDAMIQNLSRDFQQRLPGGIIIGVKKSGTAFFHDILRLHSGVAMRYREVHFFDKHENTSDHEAYRLEMMYSFSDQVTMEKTPRYWVTPSAPEEIHRLNPDIKLILLVREPACRVVSDYHHEVKIYYKSGIINKTMSLSDILTQPRYNEVYNHLLNPSFYDVHIANWLKSFPMEQIRIISNEDLFTSKLPQILFEVEEYLGLNHELDVTISFHNICIKNQIRKPMCFRAVKKKTCKYEAEYKHVLYNIREVLQPHVLQFEKIIQMKFDWF